MLKLAILGTGTGRDALTNREAVEGLTIQLDGAEPMFCSWKSLPKLIAYEMGKRTPAKPAVAPVVK